VCVCVCVFRVMRELEAVKQEALMLQEQMKMIKYDIQKVSLMKLSSFCSDDINTRLLYITLVLM